MWKLRLLARNGRLALAVCALGATAFAATAGDAPAATGDLDELFDPAYLAWSACRAGSLPAQRQIQGQPVTPMVLAALAAADNPTPPLWDNLGGHSYPITTAEPQAQRYFDQGLRLTYGFNHAEALRAFREAQRLDPTCAMCYWAEGFALGPNINVPMAAEAVAPALTATANAVARAGQASPAEQALIEALGKRYSVDPAADPKALAAAFAEAMAAVHARFPDDQDIAVLYADAVMNTTPWDYWETDHRTPKGGLGPAIAAIEGVLAANPEHPGAIHAFIHLMEASATPEKAEPYADRLAALVPGAGHLVHMPSHIYIRLGRHQDSIDANKAAIEADEAYLAETKAEGVYTVGYYPHNIHFVLQSALFAGDDASARWALDKLAGKIPEDLAAEIGMLQPVLASPAMAHAQVSDPATILALPDPGDRLPLVKAMWLYAQGIAHAQRGELEEASRAAAQIAEINATADFQMLLDWTVPAPDMVDIARHVLEGRIAQAKGDLAAAAREFEIGAQIQDSLPYMEPPYWHYPVRQSLGAAQLAAGEAEAAIQTFRQSLIDMPNNALAIYGLAEAQAAAGDAAGAEETRKALARAYLGDPARLTLSRL
jgi:tetratricopeptide (TPR) repeat protein